MREGESPSALTFENIVPCTIKDYRIRNVKNGLKSLQNHYNLGICALPARGRAARRAGEQELSVEDDTR